VGYPASSVLWGCSEHCRPSLRLGLPRLWYHSCELVVRSRAAQLAYLLGPGIRFYRVFPIRWLTGGDDTASQVPRKPQCECAPLCDPAGFSRFWLQR